METEVKTKSSVILEATKNDRTFQFIIPENSTYGDSYSVCWAFLARITELAKESVDKAKPVEIK